MGADRREVEALRARVAWALAARRPRLSKARVEALAGMGVGALSTLGKRGGKLVNVATWRRLAASLGVRLAWLLLGDGPAFWRVYWSLCAGDPPERSRDVLTRDEERFTDVEAARSRARALGGKVAAVRPNDRTHTFRKTGEV